MQACGIYAAQCACSSNEFFLGYPLTFLGNVDLMPSARKFTSVQRAKVSKVLQETKRPLLCFASAVMVSLRKVMVCTEKWFSFIKRGSGEQKASCFTATSR